MSEVRRVLESWRGKGGGGRNAGGRRLPLTGLARRLWRTATALSGPVAALLLCAPISAQAPGTTKTAVPVVIAHRGASGYLPEHTLPAYALAYGMGAAFIEPDLVMTKDGVLIALHDIHLELTTNVEEVFPERERADGRWYAADLTLGEIRRLAVHERTDRLGRPAFPSRFPLGASGFQVPTFEEILVLVGELDRLTGCRVGVYPETKEPQFHAAEGLPLEEELLRQLAAHGYRGRDALVFIQSFDPRSLERLRRELGTDLPLVQLISDDEEQDALVTDAGLDAVAEYAQGIGPSKRRIEDDHGKPVAGALVERAHARGLVVHPYTFRADVVPEAYDRYEAEVRRFVDDYGIDGFFTDHPDRAVALFGGPQQVRHCSR